MTSLPGRSIGKTLIARALWYTAPGKAELRIEQLPRLAPGQVIVKTLFSAISRGTERLVYSGQIADSERQRMRAPLQAGDFPFPVKYGYSAAGIVISGPDDLVGQTVFCLHPHQDYFIAPASILVPVPEYIPARRATLAANMETALNAHWDAGTGPGDRILIIGAGVVGMLVASLAVGIPGAQVTVTDIDPRRRDVAEAIGAEFVRPEDAPGEADIVFHTSATAAGLELAISKAGFEGTIVELSWYGNSPVSVNLGGEFHSRRLKIVSSQVGHVSASRRARKTHRNRLETAIKLLSNPALDRLVDDEVAFEKIIEVLPKVFSAEHGFAPVISYAQAADIA